MKNEYEGGGERYLRLDRHLVLLVTAISAVCAMGTVSSCLTAHPHLLYLSGGPAVLLAFSMHLSPLSPPTVSPERRLQLDGCVHPQ